MKTALAGSLIILMGCTAMNKQQFKEGFVENSQIKLYYKSYGHGEPVIIVHGGPGFDHRHMLPFKELADYYNIIFYDQRVTGNSTGSADSLTVSVGNFVDDLEALRSGLGLGKITLLGHSWGARLSMEYAIKYPANVRRLLLLSPAGSMDYLDEYFQAIQARTDNKTRAKLKKIEESEGFKEKEPKALEEYYRLSTRAFFYDTSKCSQLDFTLSERTAKNQGIVAGLLMKEIMSGNIFSGLRNINCPTLILHGEADPLPIQVPQQVHENILNSKMVVLKKAGHFMFVESPQEAFDAIRKFLSSSDKL